MPFFKDPGTESLAGEGSSHKLLPLCPAAHGRLHSLMAPPTGEISLGVSGIKPPSLWKARDSWLSSQHVGRQLIVLCHQACGESVRNPVHILGRVLSGMVLERRERKMKAGPASSCLPGKLTLLEPGSEF